MSTVAQTERGQRVALVLFRLVVAWADALASGDEARASVVLSQFARTYNEYRATLVAWIRGLGAGPEDLARFPAQANRGLSAETLEAVAAIVALGRGSAGEQASMLLPVTPSQIGDWYTTYLTPLLSGDDLRLAEFVREEPQSTLATNLFREVRELIQGDAPMQAPVPTGTDTTYELPDERITGRVARWTMPTWGWWALGLGAVAGVGYLTYRVGVAEDWWGEARGWG